MGNTFSGEQISEGQQYNDYIKAQGEQIRKQQNQINIL